MTPEKRLEIFRRFCGKASLSRGHNNLSDKWILYTITADSPLSFVVCSVRVSTQLYVSH